jgi:hypothetical protein
MKLGEPISAAEVTETGWYWLERGGPPRGYVYISTDPDESQLYLNSVNFRGEVLPLRPELHGTFYKVSNNPLDDE